MLAISLVVCSICILCSCWRRCERAREHDKSGLLYLHSPDSESASPPLALLRGPQGATPVVHEHASGGGSEQATAADAPTKSAGRRVKKIWPRLSSPPCYAGVINGAGGFQMSNASGSAHTCRVGTFATAATTAAASHESASSLRKPRRVSAMVRAGAAEQACARSRQRNSQPPQATEHLPSTLEEGVPGACHISTANGKNKAPILSTSI